MISKTVLLVLATTLPSSLFAQVPLGIQSAFGQTVTPVFEGWYQNLDGTYSVSFGYFNRNFEEVLEIPLGPNNVIEPGDFDGVQPTEFHSRRHWGVFVVKVPEDFGDREVNWTLKVRGKTFTIPGNLHRDWEIDALEGEAGSGNTPPVLRFTADGPQGAGPAGVVSGTRTAVVGQPLQITVWASDDGRASGNVARTGGVGEPVNLTWFKHQGPGDVEFSEPTAKVDATGGEVTVDITFSEPGEYTLRVRANDASGVAGAGHAQCCWTNGFVKVEVTHE